MRTPRYIHTFFNDHDHGCSLSRRETTSLSHTTGRYREIALDIQTSMAFIWVALHGVQASIHLSDLVEYFIASIDRHHPSLFASILREDDIGGRFTDRRSSQMRCTAAKLSTFWEEREHIVRPGRLFEFLACEA